MAVEGKTHSEVVAAIKAGGSVTRLLVVDPDTDAFFKRCRVVPSLDHVAGESPGLLVGLFFLILLLQSPFAPQASGPARFPQSAPRWEKTEGCTH